MIRNKCGRPSFGSLRLLGLPSLELRPIASEAPPLNRESAGRISQAPRLRRSCFAFIITVKNEKLLFVFGPPCVHEGSTAEYVEMHHAIPPEATTKGVEDCTGVTDTVTPVRPAFTTVPTAPRQLSSTSTLRRSRDGSNVAQFVQRALIRDRAL